jgi:hypothetical protein
MHAAARMRRGALYLFPFVACALCYGHSAAQARALHAMAMDHAGLSSSSRQAAGPAAPPLRAAQHAACCDALLHTSRKSKSIRVSGGSDPTACFAAPRTSTGTPGGDGASHPAPEG